MMRKLLFAVGGVVACSSFEANGPVAAGGSGGSSGGAGHAGTNATGGTGAGGNTSNGGSSSGGANAGAPSSGAGQGGTPASAGQGGDPGVGGEGGNPSLPPAMLELTGDVQDVHDPSIVRAGDEFYLFSTGFGVQVRHSTDLHEWTLLDPVFSSEPSWITTTGTDNILWAPEVRYFGGKYHLYYSASSFGSNHSCIGHATATELGPETNWVDQGQAVVCSNLGATGDNWNAIDPSPFETPDGKLWLAFGSFWTGLKLIRLDADGKRDGPDLFSIATRNNTAVEAPHLLYRDGYYYLFESVDSCCQGSNSTYKIMVGRSNSITGPYSDRDGLALLSGGGTLVLQGGERFRGPGHNAILHVGDDYYNVYHSYDADDDGVPTLRIAPLSFDDSGWPISLGP
jgi:arabinan endo-1,5-alpha-L-arabinosidase